MPFLLLPFRPGPDPVGSKSFIRNFFKMQYEGTWQDKSRDVQKELMLMEPIVCLTRTPVLPATLIRGIGTLQYHEVVLESSTRWCGHLGDL